MAPTSSVPIDKCAGDHDPVPVSIRSRLFPTFLALCSGIKELLDSGVSWVALEMVQFLLLVPPARRSKLSSLAMQADGRWCEASAASPPFALYPPNRKV
jgi:hypothetical protein